MKLKNNGIQILPIPKIEDPRGNLSVIENDIVPFDIKRVYYLYDVPSGSERGGHAHKELQEFLVALSGSFDVARNLGIEKSTGKLIAFLDADDYWFPNHLQELAHLYSDFPDCGIYCSRYKIKTAKNHFQTPYYKGIDQSFKGIIKDYFTSNMPFRITWTSSLAISKEILEKSGSFTPGITNSQDLELWTKIGIQYPVAVNNTITAIYNNAIHNSLAKKNMSSMQLMNFEQFKTSEQENPSLKKFLDLYRIEYGFKYYVAGYKEKSDFYLKNADKKNISSKIQFLLKLTPFCLHFLFKANSFLKKCGINFSVYN